MLPLTLTPLSVNSITGTPLPVGGLVCSEGLPCSEQLPCSDGPVLTLTPLT